MPDSSVQFTASMVGDDAVANKMNKLQKELVAMTAENARLKSSAAGIGEGFDQSFRSLQRFAAQTREAGKSPFDKYQADLSRIHQATRANLLTQDEAVAARRRLTDSLNQNSDAYRNQQAEAKRLDDVARRVMESQTTGAQRTQAHLAEVKKAHESGRLTLAQYQAEVRRANSETGGLSGAASKMVGDWRGAFASLIGGVTSITAGVMFAIDQARQASEEAKQLRGEQKAKQLTVAEAQGEVQKMIGDKPAAGFLADVQKIAQESKFGDLRAATQAAADTLSATRGNEQLTKQVLKYALPLQRNKPEEIPEVAGAIADLSRFMEADSEAKVKQAASLVVSAVGQARITSYADFKEAAASMAAANAASTAEDKVETVRQSAAIWAGLSQQLADKSGAQTKTAFAGLVATMEKLAPEKDKLVAVEDTQRAELEAKRIHLQTKLDATRKQQEDQTPEKIGLKRQALDAEIADLDKQIGTKRHTTGKHVPLTQEDLAKAKLRRDELATRRERLGTGKTAEDFQTEVDAIQAEMGKVDAKLTGEVRKGTGLKDTWSRVQAMWRDESLQQQFRETIEKGGFRAPAKLAMRQLADPNSALSKELTGAMAGTVADTGAFDRLVGRLQTETPQLAIKTRESEAAAQIERFDVGADLSARRAQVAKVLEDSLIRTRPKGTAEAGMARALETFDGTGFLSKFRADVDKGKTPEAAGQEVLRTRLYRAGYMERDARTGKFVELTPEQQAEKKLLQDSIRMLKTWEADDKTRAAAAAPAGPQIPATALGVYDEVQRLVGGLQNPATLQPSATEQVGLAATPESAPLEATMRLPSPAAPPKSETLQVADPAVAEQLAQMRAELRAIKEASTRGADASERVATVASGPGASTIAAQPSSHRQSR